MPPGAAHGCASLTDITLTYLVDRCYDVSDENGGAWDDPDPMVTRRASTNPRPADLAPIRPSR